MAALHIQAFPASELAKLGHEAVRRQYAWQLNGPHDVVPLGAKRSGELVGFLMGGVFRGTTIGFLMEEKWFLVRMTLRHPAVIIRGNGRRVLSTAARLLFRRKQALEVAMARPAKVSFGVQAVAVAPAAQGLGIGGLLIDEAERRARAGGYETMHLNVDPDNAQAIGFYESHGWHRLHAPSDNDDHWRFGKDLAVATDDPPAPPG